MQRSHFIVDGLWRCLCPAFDRPGRLFSAARRHTNTKKRQVTLTASSDAIQNRRRLSSEAIAPKKSWQTIAPPRELGNQFALGADGPVKEGTWDQRLLAPTPPNEATLGACSVDDIMMALAALRDPKKWKPNGHPIDQHQRIVQLVQHLVAVRDHPASLFMYECMADAMTDPQGSVNSLRRLLDEMAAQEMKPTATFCNIALEVLMNHPDHYLRQEILDIMREHWFTVDAPVKQSIVIGLLRDEQYELAYSRFVDMIEKGARIDTWMYDIFILVFGKLGFCEEMMSLLHRRSSHRNSFRKLKREDDGDGNAMVVVDSLLYYALDVCSQASHYEGTVFTWNAVIKNSRLQPSDGIVESVLGTAARQGDAQLATEAFELLSRRSRTQGHHYEAVIDAFCKSGDLPAAFRVLGIMRDNGVRISKARTRSVRQAMKERRELIRVGEAAVREMARETTVPQELVGVILEMIAETEGSQRAMELYRDVPLLCGGERPGATMMQDVVANGPEPQITKALLQEYAARFSEKSDPPRSAVTYGALMLACLEVDEVDLAFRFAKRALAPSVVARSRKKLGEWLHKLIDKAMEREDGRIWPVLDRLSGDGKTEASSVVTRVLQQKRMAKKAADWKARQR